MLAKQKEAEYRDNLIGTDFTVCPTEECNTSSIVVIRIYITGEILSAENFPNTELYPTFNLDSSPISSLYLPVGKHKYLKTTRPYI